jgi:translation initiation factor 4E
MKRVLAFPPDTKVEWKSHDSSIQQRSAIDEARKERQTSGAHNSEKRNGNKEDFSSEKK